MRFGPEDPDEAEEAPAPQPDEPAVEDEAEQPDEE